MPVKNPGSKGEIRSFYLEKRREISDSDLTQWNSRIFEYIINHSAYIDAKTVHTYVSIQENKEVDTTRLIQHALENGKRVVVPKMVDSRYLNHFYIRSQSELTPNQWGIPEPASEMKAETDQLDLVIVPVVAGDKNRNRLGYGKGYYDRFLAQCSATFVGLLFDLQLHPFELPVEPYDIPLDILVTEKRVI